MGYPNDAERRRLERFPDRIAVEDLRACFALSDRDRTLVFDQRGAENRLGLAVSLCAVPAGRQKRPVKDVADTQLRGELKHHCADVGTSTRCGTRA